MRIQPEELFTRLRVYGGEVGNAKLSCELHERGRVPIRCIQNVSLDSEHTAGDFEVPDFLDVRLDGSQFQIGHLDLNVRRARKWRYRALQRNRPGLVAQKGDHDRNGCIGLIR